MSLLNLFKISYYVDSSIGYYFNGFWVVLGVLVALFITSLVFNAKISKYKNLSGIKRDYLARWSNLVLTISIVSLAYLFFRFQAIPYFNWRLWPLLITVGSLVWAGYLAYLKLKVIPKKIAHKEREKSKAYYFRKRRRR